MNHPKTGRGPDSIGRELKLAGRYLNVPIKAGTPRRTMAIELEGVVVRCFEIELAVDEIDYWAFVEVEAWRDRRALIRLHAQPTVEDPVIHAHAAAHPLAGNALDRLEVAEEIHDAAALYHEELRPQFHFTPRCGWHNDPNGMFWFAGEYHLFYQWQPFSVSSFSDKSWGHAVSRDLLHWEELPLALPADHEGAKWSGSGVVDWHNVSGLQQGTEPPLLLFYTATGRSAHHPKPSAPRDFVQSIAVSHDRGRTWTPYAGNPILGNLSPRNRDPWVFWHAPTQRWIMVLYVGYPIADAGALHTAQIFTSTNLIAWNYEGRIEGFFDCPILFPLPLDGDEAEPRWIIHCANMKYKVGRFDGRSFIAETDLLVGQHGDCAYAAQLFNHQPDGRRVQMAWGRTEAPGMPFSQIMTFPCALSLVTTSAGPRMKWQPVEEISRLHGAKKVWRNTPLPAGGEPLLLAAGRHFDLQLVLDAGEAAEIELNLRGIPVVWNVRERSLTAKDWVVPLPLTGEKLELRILLDRISVEIFAADGLVYMPLAIVPAAENERVTLAARGGSATAESITCAEVASIWNPAQTTGAK
ncbi:MAG: glycoside hydrolase family 32 protein [Opitutaceae bacterium]|nr:glycoside hydrolase family 32 protein [Opitutaceae bacterium]